MPSKYDKCVQDVKKKIRAGKISKTFKCDSKGKPNSRGKKRCKSNEFKICRKTK